VLEEMKERDWKISCVCSSFFILTVWRDLALKAQENMFDGSAPSGTISYHILLLFRAHTLLSFYCRDLLSRTSATKPTCLASPTLCQRSTSAHLQSLCLLFQSHLLSLVHPTARVPLSSYSHQISTPYLCPFRSIFVYQICIILAQLSF
jgi:hypothetical protein